jgi:hypothetical protein
MDAGGPLRQSRARLETERTGGATSCGAGSDDPALCDLVGTQRAERLDRWPDLDLLVRGLGVRRDRLDLAFTFGPSVDGGRSSRPAEILVSLFPSGTETN